MHLKIVTVDRTIVDEEIIALLTSSESGEFVILPDHAPLIALTVPAPTVITLPDKRRRVLFTDSGVLKVLDNELLFITDGAQWKDDINQAHAEAERLQAKEQLKDRTREDLALVKSALARAEAKIRTGRTT